MSKQEQQTLKELQFIKKLLVLLLIKSGATSEEIGSALGVDSSTIRHMLSSKKVSAQGE